MVEPSPLISPLTLVLNPDKFDAVICEPFTFICPPLVKFKLPFTNTSFDVPPVFKKMFEPSDSNCIPYPLEGAVTIPVASELITTPPVVS